MSDFEGRVAFYRKQLVARELGRLFAGPDVDSAYPLIQQDATNSFPNSSLPIEVSMSAVHIYQVQCKLIHRYCKLKSNVSIHINEGSVVIITAENVDTFDIGVVVKIYTEESLAQRMATMRPFNDKEEAEIRFIVRLADSVDLMKLPMKFREEEQMLVQCQSYVRNVFRLPLDVYGAEYQIDGKMLTFYYTSEVRADFRELVRTMFNICMVRVKMRKTNQCKKFVPVASAAVILQTGIVA